MELSFFMDALIVECKKLLVVKNHQDIKFFVFGDDFLLLADLFA